MKVDYTPKYDYEALYKIIKKLLEKRKLAIVRDEFHMDNNDYYCRILFKLYNRKVNVQLTALDEENISLSYSYWASENRVDENNSPLLQYTLLRIPTDNYLFGKNLKYSFKLFKKMLKVHLRNYKEIKNEVKIKLYGKYKIK